MVLLVLLCLSVGGLPNTLDRTSCNVHQCFGELADQVRELARVEHFATPVVLESRDKSLEQPAEIKRLEWTQTVLA